RSLHAPGPLTVATSTRDACAITNVHSMTTLTSSRSSSSATLAKTVARRNRSPPGMPATLCVTKLATIQGGDPMSITPASNQEQTTDPNTVAQRIRQAILDGNFSPNQRMVEADLCEEFHASRGAVRAALLDLTNQGLIERIQNRGARVRSVSLPEAIEITEIRMVVEGLCAAKAAENITEAEIVELMELREG